MRATLEKVSLRPGESFACRRFASPRFGSPWHFHPECELTLIEASHGLRFVGDSIGRFERGDLVLLGANLPHYWSNSPDWSGTARSVVVQFSERFMGEAGGAMPELASVRRLLGRAQRGLLFPGATVRTVAERLGALPDLAPLPRLAALLEIFHTLADAPAATLSSAGFSPGLTGRDEARLARVLRYVDGAVGEAVSQKVAAQRAGLSPAAFSRYFRRKMGHTFEAFVNEVRVGRICRELLDDPSRSVAEIAFAGGYNNLANFNRQFLRRTGLTPGAFRRSHGATSGSAAGGVGR
ncbi:helix-turn-helix domain-containing protein [Horticoccus luteus]|uniref:Helix-turn-helix domain-containing protein n=1 Tax=Horticoccus luteus TaxID=2862869 RepID=A0A8F9TS50_9BACT|nr:helix-turn-helix domain-containing protein [Horticoccus luteus]QYM78209.1 helix-turn-helix domain-containing protein [Horticoccus luteus]